MPFPPVSRQTRQCRPSTFPSMPSWLRVSGQGNPCADLRNWWNAFQSSGSGIGEHRRDFGLAVVLQRELKLGGVSALL